MEFMKGPLADLYRRLCMVSNVSGTAGVALLGSNAPWHEAIAPARLIGRWAHLFRVPTAAKLAGLAILGYILLSYRFLS